MKFAEYAPKRLLNYAGFAVAAVPVALAPQALVVGGGPETALRSNVRAGATSESGRWLDDVWASHQGSVEALLSNLPQHSLGMDAWYETPADVTYPAAREIEILDVEILELETVGRNAPDALRFTDTSFDAWA